MFFKFRFSDGLRASALSKNSVSKRRPRQVPFARMTSDCLTSMATNAKTQNRTMLICARTAMSQVLQLIRSPVADADLRVALLPSMPGRARP